METWPRRLIITKASLLGSPIESRHPLSNSGSSRIPLLFSWQFKALKFVGSEVSLEPPCHGKQTQNRSISCFHVVRLAWEVLKLKRQFSAKNRNFRSLFETNLFHQIYFNPKGVPNFSSHKYNDQSKWEYHNIHDTNHVRRLTWHKHFYCFHSHH